VRPGEGVGSTLHMGHLPPPNSSAHVAALTTRPTLPALPLRTRFRVLGQWGHLSTQNALPRRTCDRKWSQPRTNDVRHEGSADSPTVRDTVRETLIRGSHVLVE
jgi:hypothetical protein